MTALYPAAAWTGEGLPPEGLKVEALIDGSGDWVEVTLKYQSLDFSVFQKADGTEFPLWNPQYSTFRPVRTAEQIEKDERLHALRNAATDIAKTLARFENDLPGGAAAQTVMEAMIEAGYRKHAAPVIEEDTSDIDYSIKPGDTVVTDHWTHSSLEVIDANWALRAVAVRLGPTGGIVVWPARGMKKVTQ